MADNIVTISLGNGAVVDALDNTAVVNALVSVDYTTNSYSGTYSIVGATINTSGLLSSTGGLLSSLGVNTITGDGLSLVYDGDLPTVATSVTFTGPPTGSTTPDTFSGLNVSVSAVACYLRDTRILMVDGQVAVQDLAVGDLVITASGEHRAIRWIGHRSYAGRFANANPDLLPICVKAGAIADNIPSSDLWVSPMHALFVDGVLIPAAALVNGASVIKAAHVDALEYWHVELDSHDVLMAEGMPSESFVNDNGRNLFHNAQSYRALYPDDEAVEAVYCAPRVESGHALAEVRRRIDERAGLAIAPEALFGELRGSLDICNDGYLAGWAQDSLYPDAPVCLDILFDGEVVALAYANQHRPDLAAAGIGAGSYGFGVDLSLTPEREYTVAVRRSADGAALGKSRQIVPAAKALFAA